VRPFPSKSVSVSYSFITWQARLPADNADLCGTLPAVLGFRLLKAGQNGSVIKKSSLGDYMPL
jgi:hypothetical protein